MALADDINLKIVGKLDQVVYYYIDGVQYKRAYVIPVQPGTEAQVAWWNTFTYWVNQWHMLTPAQRDTWNEKAKRKQMSGFNLYMSVNLWAERH